MDEIAGERGEGGEGDLGGGGRGGEVRFATIQTYGETTHTLIER